MISHCEYKDKQCDNEIIKESNFEYKDIQCDNEIINSYQILNLQINTVVTKLLMTLPY